MLPEILKENAKIVYKDLKIVKQISGPDSARSIKDASNVEGGTQRQRRHFPVKYFAVSDN